MKTIAVIPAYNEVTRIAAVVKQARPYVNDILVVDDGSTDGTAKAARDAGAIMLQHVENCGAGAATMTGIAGARAMGAEVLITLDADGQHDPEDIPALLQPVRDGRVDIVFANRFGQRNHIPFVRRLFNGIGNFVTFAATGRWVSDSQCGFKVFGPKALREIDLRMSGFEYSTSGRLPKCRSK
jgi:glycosyltransferase involved in cell wall biosynthesis